MARTARWLKGKVDRGVRDVRLSSWKYFSDFVNQELINFTTLIFRGHGDSTWKLEPTLDRIIKSPKAHRRETHLERFKLETRGRRGSNPPSLVDENDWWALGQHHGLSTPLLDWTESPFVALYFAAASGLQVKSYSVAVYALAQAGISRRNTRIYNDDAIDLVNDRKPTVKIVRPQSDENSRLVSQRGVFTRGPNNIDLESWVKSFAPDDEKSLTLLKLNIPKMGLQDCLRYLNRMNINHSTLFPDLTGASSYCNRHLEILRY